MAGLSKKLPQDSPQIPEVSPRIAAELMRFIPIIANADVHHKRYG